MVPSCFLITLSQWFFFWISNKDLLITKRERHPSTQEVYRGEQIKYRNYINQENPKKKKNYSFSMLRTLPVRFLKKKLEIRHRTLIVFKTPTISFIPNTPHQTMRDNHPYISIVMATKLTLPASKKLNNKHWHNPTNSI